VNTPRFLSNTSSRYICIDNEIDTVHIEPGRSSTVSGDTIILPSPVRIPPPVAARQCHDKFSFAHNSNPLMELPRPYDSASGEEEGGQERPGAWCLWPANQTEIHQGNLF